ncbi:hypothetical protein UFOVP28_57 [uncultured Caudovirales phage]|uniref:Uncharacterized protein n=1 Tax=uncultured Caudovirales phage TaxID=2100421 RepID=A0A6J5KRJ5_9CAUD|nr:hypothetical protein UFOVP28_57 [uncultured Caudovirales phage]
MGKDGGSSTPQSQTVFNSNLPPELLPYAKDILNQGEALANQPYVPYSGQRLANQSDFTTQAYGQAGGLGDVGSGSMNDAGSSYANAMAGAGQVAGQGPMASFNSPHAAGVDQVHSQSWTDPGVAQSFMSPYETNVLRSQLGLANTQFGEQQNQRNSQAIGQGAFGGSRAALVNEAAQRDFNNSQFQMIGQGLNSAYTTGQQAFQANNSANLLAQEANQQANQNTQNTNVQSDLSTNQLNSTNYNTGQSTALNAAGLQNQIGNSQSALGQAQQSMAGTGLNALYAAGQSAQNYQQQGLNIGYDNFVNQQQYPEQQLNFMSGLMHGFNVSPNSYSTTSSNYTNPVTQLVGAGTGIAGIASALGKGG